MSISEQEIAKVARLARLRLNEKNIVTYTHSLSNILDLIAHINNCDTTKVEPMSSPFRDATLTLRADEVIRSNHRDFWQSLAPLIAFGLYLVPQVIEAIE